MGPFDPLQRSIPAVLLFLCAAAPAGRLAARPGGPAERPLRAFLISTPLPGVQTEDATRLRRIAEGAGYEVRAVNLGDPVLSAAKAHPGDLLIIPSGNSLPLGFAGAVLAHLRRGTVILAFDTPLFRDPAVRYEGRWLSRTDALRLVAERGPEHVLLDFEEDALSGWKRHSDTPERTAVFKVERIAGGRALHVRIENLRSWDTLEPPPFRDPFPEGHTYTCFRARGGHRTSELAIEWIEQDGSRWIATVQLGKHWKRYAVPAHEFKAWDPPPGRGGPADRFHPERAVRLRIGLALSHCAVGTGRHDYWIDDFGTSAGPEEDGVGEAPYIEGLSPEWVAYPVREAEVLEVPEDLAFTSPRRFPPPPELRAFHPRARAGGYAQGRKLRWEPLLVARGARGEYRGAPAVLVLHRSGSASAGAMTLSFAIPAGRLLGTKGGEAFLGELLRAQARGLFLAEGGAEYYTLFPGQSFRAGVRALRRRGPNRGLPAAPVLRLRIEAARAHAGSPLLFERPLSLPAAGEEGGFEVRLSAGELPAPSLTAVSELVLGGAVIDRLRHPLHVFEPSRDPRFVKVKNGAFELDGRPWKVHGVNYMPSSGIALPDHAAFEYWLDRGPYDPEIIGRDLDRIAALGLNAVSIFMYHRSLRSQHLLDFLRQARERRLKVNLSLRPGTPLDFHRDAVREAIEYYRLRDNDTVFAYDLAWEPSHYDYNHRARYRADWMRWVLAWYGSVEKAEAAWGFSAPRREGALDVPPSSHLVKDGPWRRLVADYRAFLDDLLARHYGEARRFVRSLDPNHLVSFRMQFAGDPTFLSERLLPYDFYGLRNAVDIWEPEAYGRFGPWERVRDGRFTVDYARLCDPSKPVVWAEVGYNVWSRAAGGPDPRRLAEQARYFRDFYRMLMESGSDGVVFWWYAGGYRANERSDYGILEPDGTDRPSSRVIRKLGQRFLAAPKPPPPDFILEIDRDRDARGLYGVYEAVRERYWRAIEAGRRPALRWLRPPGNRGARGK